jgi:hypothetical protein
MELINRYAAEVGRRLPETLRPDIEKELCSILEDMLDDRSRAAGKPADEEMTVALLKEYGEPSKVAATYHAPRYLVGPAVYPTFVMVMKIVLTVIAVLAVLQFGFTAVRQAFNPLQIARAFGQAFSTFFNGGLTALGIVTLIFAINERVNPNLKLDAKEWNPRDLRPVTQTSSRINTGDLIASIVFNIIAIVAFNLYFDRIGIYSNLDGVWSMVPIFSAVLKGYVVYFTFLWGLEIALDVYVLQNGRWDATTRWLAIGHALASIALFVVILLGPSIAAPAQQFFAAWQEAGLEDLQITSLQNAMDIGVRSIIAIILIVEIVDMGKQVWGLLQGREA